MKKVINHLPFSQIPKISRGNGIVNHLIASKNIGASKIHSGITVIPPKTSVPAHSHNTEEQVTILKGSLKIIFEIKFLDSYEKLLKLFSIYQRL